MNPELYFTQVAVNQDEADSPVMLLAAVLDHARYDEDIDHDAFDAFENWINGKRAWDRAELHLMAVN